jgi:hypothetical protein
LALEAYIAEIKAVVDRYGATAFVVEARVSYELRPGGQCYLDGSVTFVDRSVLHFREFLDQVGEAVDKMMYVYHYQTVAGDLLFRYDNARHRPPLPFDDHRHAPEGITESLASTLEFVLAEATRSGGWV